MRYQKHVFICTNRRDPEDPKGCCAAKGSEEIRAAMKKRVKELGLQGRIRINASGCLDACRFGPSAVVYPDCVWYGGLTLDNVDEIIESDLMNDVPGDRLVIRDPRYLAPEELDPDLANVG